ncbi:MAG TPA: hypothetical protein DCZ94_02810 [Lentisphaeria bacterium]|nr:MAG: hypothetical protein A2X48_08035 [Lentisphaerae bacterium GWF2_49_21]HBC85864.1 hypothetical protein [Lentisphaeria bacterium]
MQQIAGSMIGFTVNGVDGELGKLKDFYFDDLTWTFRYMVVETGEWLSGREVLIAHSSISKSDWAAHVFHVNLNREQVRNSPSVDTGKAVPRKFETVLQAYYSWNTYWGGGFYVLPGSGMDMFYPPEGKKKKEDPQFTTRKIEHNLRSTSEIIGYHIHAKDGDIGHVEDFIVNKKTWDIRYLIVDLQNWLPGRRVLVSPCWINRVSWDEEKVFVDISRNAVRKSPAYDPSKPFSIDYEYKLLEHLQKKEGSAWVTFKFHAPPGADVFVAGTFNKWNPMEIRLEDEKKGKYVATVLMPEGRIEYKFIVNGNWCNSPECKELVPNDYGTTNSVLFVGQGKGHKGHLHTFSRFSFGELRPLWSTPIGG